MSDELSSPRLSTRLIEVLAVVLNLLFTFFYLRFNPVCYLFGIAGPIAFIYLCAVKKLYAEIVLQIVYIGLALYGWLTLGQSWPSDSWNANTHLLFIGGGVAATFISGNVLKKYTNAQLPFLDSTTTVFGIIAAWAMVNYVHENWLYFIAINMLSIILYSKRKMYLGSAMFTLYLVMAIDGYFQLHWFYP